jgi:hypothetical protein
MLPATPMIRKISFIWQIEEVMRTRTDYRSNIIWPDPQPYSTIVAITSEDCPGLDSRWNSRTIDIPEIREIS